MRIVIAEDAAVVREGLVQLLGDRGLEVVASVGDAPALLAAVAEHRPDAVVADIRMPPGHRDDGLRAALTLRERYPELGVLLFSQYVETRYADRLATTGMSGFGYLLNGSSTSPTSSTLCAAWPPEARRSTPRWSPSCCPSATGTRATASRR
jgi:DNA-binding NarL/FixJ family response regulator